MRVNKRIRRTRYFIDRYFQTNFILKFCLITIAASLLIGILIYYFNRQTTTVAFENLKIVVKSTADFILPIMLQILVSVTFLVGIATIAVTLFASHKIAGPLYRLKMELEKIKKGDFSSPISIRAKDQAQNLAVAFEEMRVEVRNSISALKDNWGSIKTRLQKLQDEIKDEVEKRRLGDGIERIDSELARFKV